jgi:hypothetical protein
MMPPAARRRIVRSLAVLPLLLCVFGWVWSYVHTERISYIRWGRHWAGQIAVGELDLWSGATTGANSGWSYVHMHPDREIGELYAGLPDWHFLGAHFFWGAHPYSPGVNAVLLVVPFWMLSIVAGLAPILLWWRARKRRNPGGFPIEATEPKT